MYKPRFDISPRLLSLVTLAAAQRRFGERAPAVLRRIAQIVSNEKPAHVSFTIRFEEGG